LPHLNRAKDALFRDGPAGTIAAAFLFTEPSWIAGRGPRMDPKISALERAFQLTGSGQVETVDKPKKRLDREGYDSHVVLGPTLISQLRNRITPISSPVPGLSRTGVGNLTSFNSPQGSGPLGSLGAFIDGYSGYLSSANIDPTMVNGWTQALEFSPTTPVPELSTWAMMAVGFVGLGFAGWRSKRDTGALAA
jgi:hypothetical protein